MRGKSKVTVPAPRLVQQQPSSLAQQQQPWSASGSRVRAPLSTSYAKLSIVATTLVAHYLLTPALAAPFGSEATLTGQDDVFTSRKHSPADEDAPRTPLKLAFDILSIAGLVILGGIFAGLTLGLMDLDMVNLQVLSTSGTPDEQQHAKKVLKLLEKGRHWVLVVLLLGNVIVNETLPIFLSDFGGGLAAVLSSTLLIVIFGEIVPQSICARHGLAIGAFCAPLVHAAMIIFAPVAWPTAKLLDYCLGEEHGTTYRKAELKTFVSLHQQVGTDSLNEDEVTIIRAVLDLNDKTVKDIMTPIEDVYTLASDSVLNEDGIAKLVNNGYSRIPVHEPKKPDAVLGMLLVKQLISYDPDDAEPVSSFALNPLPEASPDLTLFDCLNYFQQGRSHMILVSKHPGEPRGALGVVTLEDVIEELIGREIVDESDVFTDVHNKIRVIRKNPASTQEQWQPLIRGIIERRRKFGGMMKTPLRSSYGMPTNPAGTMTPSQSQTDGKYGSMGQIRAVQQVTVKRPDSPSDWSSRRSSEAGGHRDLTLSRRSTLESNASEPFNSPPRQDANGAYLIEIDGHGNRPRVWGHADLTRERIRENPSAEARAADGSVTPIAERSDPTEADAGAEGERKPLLGRIGKFVSGDRKS